MKKENIQLMAWLKNNEEWYYPENEKFLDIDNFSRYEVLHYHNKDNFLVYCWDAEKTDGRLFKAKYK